MEKNDEQKYINRTSSVINYWLYEFEIIKDVGKF